MLSVLEQLVKNEHPDLILFKKTKPVKYSTLFQCAYRKDASLILATSFYTHAWVSKSPLGSFLNRENMKCITLQDVATVDTFCTKDNLLRFSNFTLNNLQIRVRKSLKEFTISLEEGIGCYEFDDTCHIEYFSDPMPVFSVRITHDTSFIGTFIILQSGAVEIVMQGDERIFLYAQRIKDLTERKLLNGF